MGLLKAAATATAVSVAVGVLAGCSSSGGATPSSSPAGSTPGVTPTPLVTSAPATSGPATSATPSPSVVIGLPTPTSTATTSILHRPAGARQLSSDQCTLPVVDLGGIPSSAEGVLKAYAHNPEVATDNLKTLPTVLASTRREITKVRGYWLAAGYPASFATVRDLDRLGSATDSLFAAAAKANWPAVEKVYLPLNSAYRQYLNDANDELCPE